MGSRLHGNDGGVSWLPTPRRGGRVSNPPLREPVEGSHPHPCPLPLRERGQEGPRTRSPFVGDSGRTRGSAPTLGGRGGHPHPRIEYGAGSSTGSGQAPGPLPSRGPSNHFSTSTTSAGSLNLNSYPSRASLAVNAGLVCGQNFAEAAGDDLFFAVAEVDGDDGDAALGPSGAQ